MNKAKAASWSHFRDLWNGRVLKTEVWSAHFLEELQVTLSRATKMIKDMEGLLQERSA